MLAELPKIRDEQEEFYRDLHRHPELSRQEVETARKVADRLRGLGYETHDGVGGTGVVGVLANGPGPTVLLRADMDALPVQEATGLEYASTVRATDADGNDVPVMHACGHDVDVALAQHVLPAPAGHVGGRAGALLSAADSMR
ncbi:MAG: amidohydrolase, partial [Actinomycetota bacterium]|nr:amidohydrolase [Actinomycetota bacterium]